MKKIVFKKFFRDTSIFFILITISITFIVWVIQAVNFLDFVTEDGHSFKIYYYYTFLNYPKILSRVMPFLFFISLFYTIIKYDENNELVIFWINGITKVEFINHIIRYSFLFLFLQFTLTVLIVPKFSDMARSFIRVSNVDFFPSLIKERKFIDTVSDLTIFIDSKKKNGNLKKIFLKDELSASKSQIIYAKEGKITKLNNENFLILYDGEIINTDKGKSTIISFKKTEFNLSKYTTKTTTFPKIQEVPTAILLKCLRSIYNKNPSEFNNGILDCKKDTIKDVTQEFLKRTYKPLYLTIIAFITSLLILRSKEDKNYSTYKLIIFSAGIISIIFSEIFIRYAGTINFVSVLILLIPIILFITAYIIMIKKGKLI